MSGEASLVEKLPTQRLFGKDVTKLENGQYVVKSSTREVSVKATDDQIQYLNWFSTPPLTQEAIDRLAGLQLFAESHDQGFVDNPFEGNWTWFELQIMENEGAKDARIKDQIKLVWTSHYNRVETKDFGWGVGKFFGGEHGIFGQLQPGNVITVTLCARFKKWEIFARNGYLVLKLGDKTVKRKEDYNQNLKNAISVNDALQDVNKWNGSAPINLEIDKSSYEANNFQDSDKPLRVLSLDGGGVRGISSLYILKQIMKEYGEDRPCRVFDLIAGTSTGGLIAIMLGRLGMTIDECINAYQDFATKVFKNGVASKYKLLFKGAYYSDKDLVAVIQKCVEDVLQVKDAKLQGMAPVEGAISKVFVMAVRKDSPNNRGPVLLRSYPDKKHIPDLADIQIWQAGRATTAAPTYFNPITVGKYELVDGGLGANNPVGWVWNECLKVFGMSRPISCFLSIGTGIPRSTAIGRPKMLSQQKLAEGLAGAVTNSQIMHLLFQALIDAYAPVPGNMKYWRFNVNQDIPEIFTDEIDGKLILEAANEKREPKTDPYKNIGQLDDVKLMAALTEMTVKYTDMAKEQVIGCVTALKLK